ncbi:MAG: hypothetical protein U0U67_04220 [Chitinophagales bacterium]
MKRIFAFFAATTLCAFLFSCKKDGTTKLGTVNESLADTLHYFRYQEQTLINDSKTTTGTVTLFGNKNIGTPDTLLFVFRNFSLNADAEDVDVRGVLNISTPTSDFVSVGSLKGKSGNFLYKKVNSVNLYSAGYLLLYKASSNEKYGHVEWAF